MLEDHVAELLAVSSGLNAPRFKVSRTSRTLATYSSLLGKHHAEAEPFHQAESRSASVRDGRDKGTGIDCLPVDARPGV